MKFHVVTLFPEMIEHAARFGVVGQAIKEDRVQLSTISPREFTSNVHQTIDDRPFGGGDGMIMMAEPLALTLESLTPQLGPQARVIHLSPRGPLLSDAKARDLTAFSDIVLISSRYGGADQRFLNEFVDEELSIGDFIISGGELASLVVIDAVSRLLPGVLGNEASPEDESFAQGRGLEHPQYTRPREWRGLEIPAALLSGHHSQIKDWKELVSLLVTAERRPDLLTSLALTEKILIKALKLYGQMSTGERSSSGLALSFEEMSQRLKAHSK
jgi:tRNA (guanine37-N1)-methyltransferase